MFFNESGQFDLAVDGALFSASYNQVHSGGAMNGISSNGNGFGGNTQGGWEKQSPFSNSNTSAVDLCSCRMWASRTPLNPIARLSSKSSPRQL